MALNFVRRDDLSDGDLKALLGQKERDGGVLVEWL